MLHLAMFNDTVPASVAKTFVCGYVPHVDQFTSELAKVNCKSCLRQVKKARVLT